MLSFLLPSYNNKCLQLVRTLQAQASGIDGLEYEIIVADDGGDDFTVKEYNNGINELPSCRYIIREKNVGRSAIRNYLASQAKGQWLIFIDSDISVDKEDYVKAYYDCIKQSLTADSSTPTPDTLTPTADISTLTANLHPSRGSSGRIHEAPERVSEASAMASTYCGGVEMIDDDSAFKGNLRYKYEHAEAHNHTAEARNKRPYESFRTTNFMINHKVFDEIKFDERFINYGYEDVMFGKRLRELGFEIRHIDNPVVYSHFESNALYLQKIDEAMRTLKFFQQELQGYSPLLSTYSRLKKLHIVWLMKAFNWFFYPMLKLNLLSKRPSLMAFRLYKLGRIL